MNCIYLFEYRTTEGDIMRVSAPFDGSIFIEGYITTEKNDKRGIPPQFINRKTAENILNFWKARGILL